MSVGHFYSDLVLRESLLWNGLLSKSIIFCVWPAGFSSVLLTRKPLNIAWLVSLHKHIRLTWAPKIAGHGCALSVPCATTICFSAQKEKKWFNSVSRNQSCSALDLQLQNGGDRFGQLSCPGIYFAQYVPLQNNSCKLFTRVLFSIGLWNSSGRSNRLAFTPQKSVHVWQKEKVWKLLLLLKETWQLSLLWTNVCVLKTLTVQPCVLGILLMERSQFPTRFPSRARRASIPLVRELSLQVLEWMEEMADLVSPGCAQERIHGTDISFSLPSFFWSSPDTVWQVRYVVSCLRWKLRVWQAVFSRKLSLWRLYRTALSNKTVWCKHSIRSNLEKLWWPISVPQNMPLCVKCFVSPKCKEVHGRLLGAVVPNIPATWLGCACNGWHKGTRAVCTLLLRVLSSPVPELAWMWVCLEVGRTYGLVAASIPHPPHHSAQISLAPVHLLALNFSPCLLLCILLASL